MNDEGKQQHKNRAPEDLHAQPASLVDGEPGGWHGKLGLFRNKRNLSKCIVSKEHAGILRYASAVQPRIITWVKHAQYFPSTQLVAPLLKSTLIASVDAHAPPDHGPERENDDAGKSDLLLLGVVGVVVVAVCAVLPARCVGCGIVNGLERLLKGSWGESSCHFVVFIGWAM